jgi:hypothetical protein
LGIAFDNRDRLFEIAMRQEGYFSASQAKDSGYETNNHSRLVASGQWVRLSRGVFRLAGFPPSSHEDLVLISFWSRSRGGSEPRCIFSHETALALRNLGDFNPANVNIVMPDDIAIRAMSRPPGNVRIIQETVPEDHWEVRGPINVACALWAVLQILARGDGDPELLISALLEGIEKGIVTLDSIEAIFQGAAIPKKLARESASKFLREAIKKGKT